VVRAISQRKELQVYEFEKSLPYSVEFKNKYSRSHFHINLYSLDRDHFTFFNDKYHHITYEEGPDEGRVTDLPFL
jgi:hypothetical protein